jgi:hypothetical protein
MDMGISISSLLRMEGYKIMGITKMSRIYSGAFLDSMIINA